METIKRDIIKFAKKMEQIGMANAYEGNLSVKKEGLIYITPSGKSKSELVESMIAVINERGEWVGGDFKPSSELPMHTEAYSMRSDATAVIHAHPLYLTSYALCHKSVTCRCYPEMITLFYEIPVVPYGCPGTNEIYAGIRPYLEESKVVLLANHGALSVGADIQDAFNLMLTAESIAKLLTVVKDVGTPVDLSESDYGVVYNWAMRNKQKDRENRGLISKNINMENDKC